MYIRTYDNNLTDRQTDNIVYALQQDKIVVLPTDTLYAFVCDIHSKKAAMKLAELKGKTLQKSNFSILCENLSQATEYIRPLSKECFSFIKNLKTGGFTFVLQASNLTPKIFQSKKRTIGIRLPENKICLDVLKRIGNPLLVSSVPHGEDMDKEDYCCAELIADRFDERVSLVVEGEGCAGAASTVVDLTGDDFIVIRQGLGVLP